MTPLEIARQLRAVSHDVFSPPKVFNPHRVMLQVCGRGCVGTVEIQGWLVSMELTCLSPTKAEAIMRLLVDE
jgi:hypothetical protein